MRNLLRIRRRTVPQPGLADATTDQQRPQRITAHRIRNAYFPTRRRRGYDPTAVHDYLGQVADEIVRLHQQLAAAYTETDHIKRHLRQWQTEHATTCRNTQPRTSDRPHWPINEGRPTTRIYAGYRN